MAVGNQGGSNLSTFIHQKDARVVAVCDAFKKRAENLGRHVDNTYGATGCKAHQDFRKIIEDPAIDAVVISTPDHWHVPMSIMALEAGKDVFCEKPTLNIDEGRTLIDTVQKHKAVFQVGHEERGIYRRRSSQ